MDHAHPEYSTPEVTNVRDLIAYERAGERTLETARRAATALLPEGQTILIHKNNSDRKGNSYGCHENYLISRRTPFKDVVEFMTPFLVTRQIFCGAGKVGSENRADALRRTRSASARTSSRPRWRSTPWSSGRS